eukprot:COSAG01_NODE_438_length_17037_cov_13.150136_2_plen_109_part_00
MAVTQAPASLRRDRGWLSGRRCVHVCVCIGHMCVWLWLCSGRYLLGGLDHCALKTAACSVLTGCCVQTVLGIDRVQRLIGAPTGSAALDVHLAMLLSVAGRCVLCHSH